MCAKESADTLRPVKCMSGRVSSDTGCEPVNGIARKNIIRTMYADTSFSILEELSENALALLREFDRTVKASTCDDKTLTDTVERDVVSLRSDRNEMKDELLRTVERDLLVVIPSSDTLRIADSICLVSEKIEKAIHSRLVLPEGSRLICREDILLFSDHIVSTVKHFLMPVLEIIDLVETSFCGAVAASIIERLNMLKEDVRCTKSLTCRIRIHAYESEKKTDVLSLYKFDALVSEVAGVSEAAAEGAAVFSNIILKCR